MMKKTILITMSLLASSFCINADSDTPPESDVIPIKFAPKNPGKGSRMPAMPIYGEYIKPTIYLNVNDTDITYELTISKDGNQVEYGTLSGQELSQGYVVSETTPFTISLITKGGVSYTAEVGY